MTTVGKLYLTYLSPPCRAVLLCGKALGIEFDIIEINLFRGEHLTPELLKMNPAHTVPIYADKDGTAMGDSHTIMAYLVGKYGRMDELYPKDLDQRAAVDRMMHFDSGTIYALHYTIVLPMWQRKTTGASPEQCEAALRMYKTLEDFLGERKWVAGTQGPSIADFSLGTSLMGIRTLVPLPDECEKIAKWLNRLEALPYHDTVNKPGRDAYVDCLTKLKNADYQFLNLLEKKV